MIRRGGVTDVPWFLARLEIKCLISIQHFTSVVIMAQTYHSLGRGLAHEPGVALLMIAYGSLR